MDTSTRLRILATEDEAAPLTAPPPPSKPAPAPVAVAAVKPAAVQAFELQLMSMILETLTERFALWLGRSTLPLVMLTIGFVLWRSVLASPTPEQLVGLGLFGAFSLLMLKLRG